jgi:diguanylate cyclase (GGDEF)-like protein/PAS domain S-box-containing protein
VDETEQLAAQKSYGLPNRTPDLQLDLLTEMTARLLGTPIAALCLLGADHQWHNTTYGVAPGSFLARDAFCAQAIVTADRLTIVGDSWLDPGFAADAALAGRGGIRFCAGAPIAGSDGRAIGALCVADPTPRELNGDAANTLVFLAGVARLHLERDRLAAALQDSRTEYRAAIDLNPQIVWSATPAGEVDDVSERWLALSGRSADQPLGHAGREAFHPEDRHRFIQAWARCLKTGEKLDAVCRLVLADSSARWFRVRAAPRRDESGRILRWYGTADDVHEHKLAVIALQESERRLGFVLEGGKLGTWELDLATCGLVVSDSCARCFGRQRGQDLERYVDFVASLHPDDRRRTAAEAEKVLAARQDLQIELRCIWQDGSLHWVRIIGRVVYGKDETPLRVLGLSLDITDRKRAEEEHHRAEQRMAYLANHDALTDLANSRLLHARLSEAIMAAAAATRTALLYINLYHYKAVNDALGQKAGHTLLRDAARRLQSCVRGEDLVARIDGDNFAVVAAGLADGPDAKAIAQRILEALSEPFPIGDQRIFLGASIGISLMPDHAAEPDQLCRNAATALDRARAAGQGVCEFFAPDMDKPLQDREALKLGLHDALARNELRLVYQPIIDLQTGRISSFEALLRWQHPQRGTIAPDEFIPLAEESGWIVKFGQWALLQACNEARDWPDGISVSVNLSVVQFGVGHLEDDVATALDHSGLAPHRLELEVTESLLLQDREANAAILRALRRTGVRIAMDDFGTGYSSLSYLRRFRFDKIKLDKSFVTGLPDGDVGDAIVEAVVGLGRGLGMVVTAEGVETRAQLDFLCAQGCTQVQGFLFSPPVPAGDIPALLDRDWRVPKRWAPQSAAALPH